LLSLSCVIIGSIQSSVKISDKLVENKKEKVISKNLNLRLTIIAKKINSRQMQFNKPMLNKQKSLQMFSGSDKKT
jgi:hypothetical protein